MRTRRVPLASPPPTVDSAGAQASASPPPEPDDEVSVADLQSRASTPAGPCTTAAILAREIAPVVEGLEEPTVAEVYAALAAARNWRDECPHRWTIKLGNALRELGLRPVRGTSGARRYVRRPEPKRRRSASKQHDRANPSSGGRDRLPPERLSAEIPATERTRP